MTEASPLVYLMLAAVLVSYVILELIFWLILNLGMHESKWPFVKFFPLISKQSKEIVEFCRVSYPLPRKVATLLKRLKRV